MSVRVEKDGPVTTVIMDRPEAKNAVDPETADALIAAFESFEADGAARVAVFFGDNGVFCAGADLKTVASDAASNDWIEGDGPMGPSRRTLAKPVIAAVAGHAVAGGMELALWCDLRVLEEDAIMGVFCRRWGVPLIDGGTVRLPRLIGHGRAMDLILTGRPVGAVEALGMGLANRVVRTGTARAEAEKIAHEIAEFPQICMNSDRASAFEQWDLPFQDALKNELERGRAALTVEARDGAARFATGAGRGGSFED